MSERNINASIKSTLINNDEFSYAHLVKFERPFDLLEGEVRTDDANRYAYYTDGATDILFDGNTYRANRLTSVGTYSETTTARATSMSISLAAEDLGASIEIAGVLTTAGVFTPTNSVHNGEIVDFVESGFKEGDSIKFKYSTTTLNYVIDSFPSVSTVKLLVTGTDTDDSAFPGSNLTQTFTIEQDSIELTAALMERGITLSNTSNASPNFVNREVFIHKVFINPETGALIGNASILIFKGIIAGVSLDEKPTGVSVKWNLTSHWGDFEEVNGRLTTDEVHRALNAAKFPQIDSTLRPEYVSDLGFMHSETSLSSIANYKTQETRYRMKSKRRGGLAGLLGMKKQTTEEYQIEVQHEVDLNVHLQGKYLPVVYGVQRINGNPIFADTLNNDGKIIYTADAISEGEIHGLFNIYIDDIPLICTDDNDFDVRNASTGSDKDNSQLQCYGRMSRGNTLGGQVYSGSSVDSNQITDAIIEVIVDGTGMTQINNVAKRVGRAGNQRVPLLHTGGAAGLQHGAVYNITHPYSITQQFFHGRPNQLASDMLVSPAEASDGVSSVSVRAKGASYESAPSISFSGGGGSGATATALLGSSSTDDANKVRSINITNPGTGYTSTPTLSITGGGGGGAIASANLGGYKRQTDYWTGTLPYWGPNHRLLDTAYAATQLEIDADSTNIPEIEYVVKGKVLDCFNFDNTYRPDAALDGSDDHTDFVEGDLVVVETSVNGSSWVVDSTGTNTSNKFKIMDKWLHTTSRGTAHYRFRLDTTPNLGLVNGRATDKTRLRLKDASSNYWHMLSWDHEIIGSTSFTDGWVSAGSNVSTTGAGLITISGISAANKVKIGATTPTIQFYAPEWYGSTPGSVSGLKYAVLAAAWSGSGNANVLTFAKTNYTGATFPNTIQIRNAKEFNMTGTTVANITNSEALTNNYTDEASNTIFERGGTLHNITTGEFREVVAYGTSTKILEIDTPFLTPPLTTHKFKIDGTGSDKRSLSNPALQTLDFLSNAKYGRGLKEVDLDISSFVQSAKLCDARSDITIKLTSSPSGVAVGDVFKITTTGAANGAHVASGTVAVGGIDTTNNTITLTSVINKFAKKYAEHVTYNIGDIVYTEAGAFFRATGTGIGSGTEPTASVTGLTLLTGVVTLHKSAGSGSVASLNMLKVNPPIDYALYDSDWVKYWRYYGWETAHQREVTRHQTNFIIDTGKSVFSNINALLSHYNGILSYENGKYVLDVETRENAPAASYTNGENTNPYYIDETDIIGKIGVRDNSQKASKNTIKASLADPQLNYSTRSVTFFNSDFLKADRNIVKTGSFPYTGITNYYNARVSTEKELFQSRFSKEVSFELGPRAILLRPGQVISMNYGPFKWSNKLLRIENLSFKANCNVTVKCREYDDSIYEITKQQASKISDQTSSQYGLKRPSPPTISAVTTNKIGSILVTWVNAGDFIEGSDSTEIWKHSSDALASATLVASVDNASSFMYNAAVNENAYFWIRHTRYSKGSTGNKQYIVRSDYNASAGTLGTSLAISAGAQTVKLLPSTHVIDYSKVGAETTTVSFTTVPFNMSGTLFYEFLVGSTSKQNTQTTTFTLADSDEPAVNDAPIVVTVKVRQGSAGGTIIAQDNVSIFAVQDGQSAITGFLTNESHTVATAVDGSGASFTGAGGTFKVFYGNQDITSNAKVTFAAATGTNITGAINSGSGVYTLSNFTDSQTIGSVVFTTTILGSIVGGTDGVNDVAISKTYSIGKSKAGVNGTGSAGQNAKTVHLTASDYSIVYDKDGATPNPSTSTDITITAVATNFTDPYFKFTGDASTGTTYETSYTNGASGANADTFTFNVPTSHFSDPRLVRVGVAEADASTSEIAFDTVSIFGIKPGATGAEGDDGYTIICSNEAHTFPAASNGEISTFANSGTDFEVFSGGTQLTGLTSGTPSTNQFTVSAAVTGITAGAQSASSNKIVFANHSGMGNGTATATIVYTLNIENTTSVTKKQTFAKSSAGATGEPGAAAYSGILTNESASAISYSLFAGNSFFLYLGTGGEFKTFVGTTEQTSGVVYAITGGSVAGGNSTKTQSGLTMTLNQGTGVYTLAGTSWTTDSEVFTLTGTKGSDVVTKQFNINSVPFNSRVVLAATSQQFAYDTAGSNPSPSSVVLTASSFGQPSAQFLFEKSTNNGASFSTIQAYSSTNTKTISAGALSLGSETFRVSMRSTALSNNVLDVDQITLLRLKDGAVGAPGDDGDDGDDGDEGIGSIIIYRESSSAPSTPSAGTANPPTSWYSTVVQAKAAVSGTNLVWFSVGNKPAGSSTITWNTPIRYIENYDDVGGTKPPSDANKFITVTDGVEGRLRFNINGAGVTDYDVFSSGERTKLNRLRLGKRFDSDTIVLEDTIASQAKASAAEAAAKLVETQNRVTFPSDSTEGQFSFSIGGASAVINNVFSSGERTKLNNLRAGTLPGGSGTLESTTGSQSKSDAAETAAKAQEATNRVTFPSNSTEGQFTFKIGSASNVVNNVFSADERTKLNRLRQGKAPDSDSVLISNAGVTMSANGTLTGGGSSVQVNLNSIPDAGNTKTGAARANAGLNGDGFVNKLVPTLKGGTGATNLNALSNARITTNADGTISYDGSTAVAPSLTSITGTLTAAKGGTGATNLNALSNARITTNANGTINYDGTTSVAPTLTSITGTLTSAKGGTGATNLNALSNARITTNANGTINYDGTTSVAPTLTSITGTLNAEKGGTGATNLNAVSNSRVRINSNGTLAYDNTTTGAMTMNTITDAGNIRSRITSGFDTSGRLISSIISGGTTVSVADLRGAKERTFGAIDSSNRITGNFFDGTTTFTRAELFRVRDGFDNIGSGALTLKQGNLPTIPTSKGGTGTATPSDFLNANISEAQLTGAGAVVASDLEYGTPAAINASTSWTLTSSAFNPTATTQTVSITINHPTFGTSTVVGTWTRSSSVISNFSLASGSGMAGSGSNNWTFGDVNTDSGSSDNAFGSNSATNGLKTIFVQHSNSNKIIQVSASVVAINFSFKCLTPAMLPENLQIGDEVDSPLGKTKVVDLVRKEREGYYILENELEITNDHPILIDGEWILAEEYVGNKEYIDKPTEVIYVETENELLTVKNWTVGGKY